jgi:hypothetical protein
MYPLTYVVSLPALYVLPAFFDMDITVFGNTYCLYLTSIYIWIISVFSINMHITLDVSSVDN